MAKPRFALSIAELPARNPLPIRATRDRATTQAITNLEVGFRSKGDGPVECSGVAAFRCMVESYAT